MIYNTLAVICIALLAILTFFLIYRNFSKFFRNINKIPGPPGLPILGNLFQVSGCQVALFAFLENYVKDNCAQIFKLQTFNQAAVALITPEDIELVLSNFKHHKKSLIYNTITPWLHTGLLTSSGEKWRNRRKILTPGFHFTILQQFIGSFNEGTKILVETLDKLCRNDPCINVIGPITDFTLYSIADTSMGVKLDMTSTINSEYKKAIHDLGKLAIERVAKPWIYDDKFYQFFPIRFMTDKVVKILHEFTTRIVNERKETINLDQLLMSNTVSKKQAMLDLLLIAQNKGEKIDDEGIREEVDTFLFEGHDTTSIALTFIFLLLANNEDYQEQMRQEIIEVLGKDRQPTYQDLQPLTFTERCLKECLRLYPSVPIIGRDLGEEVRTHTGYTIPKNCIVNINIYDLHRNPKIYPDPEKFDPDRFLPENVKGRHPFAYIPFSAGSRNCIGQKFAMLELKTAMCGVLRRFYLKAIDKPGDIVFKTDLVLRTVSKVRVRFVPIIKEDH